VIRKETVERALKRKALDPVAGLGSRSLLSEEVVMAARGSLRAAIRASRPKRTPVPRDACGRRLPAAERLGKVGNA
jgi:hypothetical protein